MRTSIYAGLAALLLACGRAQELTPEDTAAVRAEVEQTLREAYDLSKPNVVERMMSIYPTSGRLVSANTGRAMTSRDSVAGAVNDFWQNVGVNMRDPKWEWGEIYVDVLSPTAAVVTATYSIPHRNPNNEPHVLGGAMTVVFRKRDGRWWVVQEHLSDRPQVDQHDH
jgi:ketosteroid isomerase-like protein